MKYFLCIILFLSVFSCAKSNDGNIEFISLKINSWGNSNYNDVGIYIEKGKSKSSVILQYQNNKDSLISKNFEIDNIVFDDFAKQCIALESVDLKKAYSIGLDGTNVSIEFGANGRSVKYSFHEPNSNTEKRDLTKFMNLSKKIVATNNLSDELLE